MKKFFSLSVFQSVSWSVGPLRSTPSSFILHPSSFLSHPASFILLISSLLFLLTACASVEPVVKIGLVAPFEGTDRAIGYDVIYSARLAVREINEAGGIGNYRVALVALDDSGEVDLARQTAASLVIDPEVVAVVGHWLPRTNDASTAVYRQNEMPFLQMGETPFDTADPASLPSHFLDGYAAVTPFDEVAGEHAGTTYDAFQLLFQTLELAYDSTGKIERATVSQLLQNLQYEGITGRVYQK